MNAPGDLITPTGRLVMPANLVREDRAAWLTARRARTDVGYVIGASEVPSILDLDGADTPAHVYRRKVHNIDTPVNEAMTFGTLLEPVIADEWARRNRVDRIDEIGLVARDGDEWAVATIDRRVFRCPVYKNTPDGQCLCEVKNMGHQVASRWHRDIPDRILAQMLFQLWVTGYSHGHCAVLAGGNQLKQSIVYADREQELTEYIVNTVRAFRTDHLIAGVEPAWNTSGKADKLIELDKATHPERVGELTVEEIGDVMEYAEAAAAASAAKRRQKAAQARLAQLANGARYVKFADQLAYSYGSSELTNVNLDALKERYPAAYDDPEVVTRKTSYTLRIDKSYKVGGK